MAMKLSPELKAIDSAVRAFNKQIETAYNKLGPTHQVTRNLVSTAKAVFGAENIRTQPTKYLKTRLLDTKTGEYHEVIQVGRGKKQLEEYGKKKLLNGKRRTPIEQLNELTRTKSGNYNRLYDVTRAHQSAINRIRQTKRQNVPDALLNIPDLAERANAIEDFITPTNEEIWERLEMDEIASIVFEAYEFEKENATEDLDLTPVFRDYAHAYHSGKDTSIYLNTAMQARRRRLQELASTPPDITGTPLSDFGDIL